MHELKMQQEWESHVSMTLSNEALVFFFFDCLIIDNIYEVGYTNHSMKIHPEPLLVHLLKCMSPCRKICRF